MKINIITLGCKVNAYESQVIKNNFLKANYHYTDKIDDAHVVVVNTCSVTNTAGSKSRKLIREVKKINKQAILVVCGCMAQEKQQLLKDLDIDILLGNQHKNEIVQYVADFLKNHHKYEFFADMQQAEFEDFHTDRYDLTRAVIKVQDGCNNYCSYCIIPYLRGRLRCKKFLDVIQEAKKLASFHQEIILSGIHTGTYYDDEKDLVDLINELTKIDSLKRIRLSSIEIVEIKSKFLKMLENNLKFCNHLHIPLQSGCNKILKLMNRRYDINTYQNIIAQIRQIRPDISITTDLIVGFPNEDEEDFIKTYEFCHQIAFSKIHVFPFSAKDGTKAKEMPNQVNGIIKKQRVKKILDLSLELEYQYAQKFLNKELDVLIETCQNHISYGHTSNYLKVMIENNLASNQLVKVKITQICQGYVKGIII